MAIEPTTPRRSKRFQPFVDRDLEIEAFEEITTWSGELLYSRAAKPDDLHEEDSFDEGVEIETVFYNAFTREEPRKKGKRKKHDDEVKEEPTLFNVGETVLVKTQAKLPSIGVIAAMWEVHEKNPPEGEDVKSIMKVKVHWFLRPSELPNVRARRDHLAV